MQKLTKIDKSLYVIFFVAVLTFLSLLIPFHPYPLSFLLKAVPLSTLVLLALRKTGRGVRVILIPALVFSMTGDIILDIDRSRFFIFGLAAFLVSHVFYIILFARSFKFNRKRLLPVIFLLIYTAVISVTLRDIDSSRIVPVYIYLFVIAAMTFTALFYSPAKRPDYPLLIPAGAAVFMLSDTIIAVNQFLQPIPNSLIYSLTLYFTAQLLIVSGLTLRRR